MKITFIKLFIKSLITLNSNIGYLDGKLKGEIQINPTSEYLEMPKGRVKYSM